MLGDFNCVCRSVDRVKGLPVRDKSAEVLNVVVHDHNLEDIGSVVTNGARPQFTHFQGDSHARLDRLYVSLELVPLCTSYEVKPVSFSDHCLVIATFGKKNTKSTSSGNFGNLMRN